MSENLAKRGALEAKFRGVELEEHEDLADDLIFEPSLQYPDRRVAIAIKNGLHVCWNCHVPVKPNESREAILGEGILVRLCQDDACAQSAGDANRTRERARAKGDVVLLSSLSEEEKVELVEEIKEKKKKYRGF